VKLSLARTLLRTEPGAVEPILDELRGDVTNALEELRTLAQGIFPPVLVERGLREALLAAAERSPLPVDVELPSRLPPEIEAATYFCCMEALQNAAKHAGPEARVRIGVEAPDGTVVFEVADDGVGFDAGAVGRSGGLVQLADRVGAVAGTISVRSAPGAGTTVTGRIPLS
jgi:signal transduction histidine kinase